MFSTFYALLNCALLNSADIWSVGCTVIEMATGKPPWSQHYQEVAALFYIGTTKSHPPIPDQLSFEAQDLLLKCLHKEPELRPSASDLLQHPFVTGKSQQHSLVGTPTTESVEALSSSCTDVLDHSRGSLDVCNLGTLNISTVNSGNCKEWVAEDNDNSMRQVDGNDFTEDGVKLRSVSMLNDFKSFNPMEEPSVDETYVLKGQATLDGEQRSDELVSNMNISPDSCTSFQLGRSLSEDYDEHTESKIRAFLDEKALELKRLQTPLYEEFYNSVVLPCSMSDVDNGSSPNYLKLPPKSRSPLGKAVDVASNASPGSGSRRTSIVSGEENIHSPMDLSSPQCNDITGPDTQQEACSPNVNFSEVQRKWKEELDQELERKREMMRVGGKTGSPIDRGSNRRTRFASPGN
ncbi:putative mitogen-activated protein kinase kinase kinase STE-STE11 family [Helianthus annuus]|nr:putative mitogen-activated protein kinase kinase kinase STE-STE11 family [Helianthus annuus]